MNNIETLKTGFRVKVGQGGKVYRSKTLRTYSEAEELLELVRQEMPIKPEPVSKHPLYGTWKNMKTRCYNPSSEAYKHYGGRGIGICDRWKDDFSAFAEDMGERPEGFTLEREDNDKDYSPDNCKWADWHTQAQNRRNSLTSDTGEKNIYRNNTGYLVVVTRNGNRMGKTHRSLQEAIEERDSILEEVV